MSNYRARTEITEKTNLLILNFYYWHHLDVKPIYSWEDWTEAHSIEKLFFLEIENKLYAMVL